MNQSENPVNLLLRKRDAKSHADFFQRRNRGNHILAIPRGDRRLRQTRAFCKLILRPAPLLSICGYGRENIFHLHHPFACVLRKLYFCLSLLFNNFNRIILTIYTSKRRMISVSQKSCFFIGHRETPEEIYPVLCAAVEEHIARRWRCLRRTNPAASGYRR